MSMTDAQKALERCQAELLDTNGTFLLASQRLLNMRQFIQAAAEAAGIVDSLRRTLDNPVKQSHDDVGEILNRLAQFSEDLTFTIATLHQ